MLIEFEYDKDFERQLEYNSTKYGEDMTIINGFSKSQLSRSAVRRKLKDAKVIDASIDGNANVYYKDAVTKEKEAAKPQQAMEVMSETFAKIRELYSFKDAQEWFELEFNGGYYFHDRTHKSPYCYAFDLTRLATEGIFIKNGNHNHRPAKHLDAFCHHVFQFITIMCRLQSGAIGLPNLLIWTFYFWKKDVENGYCKDATVWAKQNLQSLIHQMNQPVARIDESAFTNVSIFDRNYIQSLFGGVEYPDGTFVMDYVEEIIKHEKLFMECVAAERPLDNFTFPVLTYSLLTRNDITKDEADKMLISKKFDVFVDKEFARWCSDHNVTWNDSNFFVNDNVNVLSNCCRLLSDTSKLDAFINSIGGTALSIGSVRVNTINLARIAYEAIENASNRDPYLTYFDILTHRTRLCCKVLHASRECLKDHIADGDFPNYCDGGIDINKQYCTIGILGLYEAIELLGLITKDEFGNTFYTDKAISFASEVFETINTIKDDFQCDFSFNIESVPGERAAVVLCKKDNMLFENHADKFIYSNQWIPLTSKTTINEKLRISSILDNKCSGGAIAHINLENRFPNTDVAWEMLNIIALKKVIYFAFNIKINVCEKNHGFVGTNICPTCGRPVFDTYQRVVGFLTPSKHYSADRFKEFSARKWFDYVNDLKEI